jgi:hypothetical protein
MPRIQFTGTGKLYFCTTISNTAAPTVAQVSAGVNLTGFLRQDGLDRSEDGALVDTATAADLFDTTDIGTSSAKLELTLYRDTVTADDDAWAALPKGTRGYLVVAPFGFSGASGVPAAADRCEVWQIAVSSRSMAPIGKDTAQTFKVTCAVPSAPVMDSVVAA